MKWVNLFNHGQVIYLLIKVKVDFDMEKLRDQKLRYLFK